MAHPARRARVTELLEELGVPESRVVWDKIQDRWDTGRRSLLHYIPTSEWHIVVQDDALPCADFLEHAAGALEQAGPGPVSFYLGRTPLQGRPGGRLVNRARRSRCHWVRARGPNWGVAVAIRTADIPELVEWCDAHPEPQYDLRMMAYFDHIGRSCLYSIPSLVNHRVGPDNPSLIPGRGSSFGRQAAWYLSDPRRAIGRWTPRAITI